jgi:UDP-N-acetyl-D-galactosamine dehydrogenase
VGEAREALHEYGVKLVSWDKLPKADAVVAAVSHKEFLELPLAKFSKILKKGGVFTDVKSAFDPDALKRAGYKVWRL